VQNRLPDTLASYQTSKKAITDKRAMIVVSKDGFIDWAWGSKRLFKSGIYYRARQETVPLPELSLAARRDPSIDAEIGFVHPKGVWVGNEEVNEMTVFAGKSDLAITLLLYPNNGATTSKRSSAPEGPSYP
jgi:hypothetical protein